MSLVGIIIAVLVIYIVYKLMKKISSRTTNPIFELFAGPPHPVISSLKNELKRVCPQIEKMKIVEGESSFTLNKKKISLCLKDKKTNKLYGRNMLTYVLLHEMAHVMNTGNADPNEDIGHTKAFHAVFDKLLAKAEKLGLYDPSMPLVEDYAENCQPS